MVSKIVKKVFEKIEKEEKLYVSVDCGASRLIDAVVPDNIITEDDGIYIEGENLILNITNEEDFKVSYDDAEKEFIIEQGNATYHLF